MVTITLTPELEQVVESKARQVGTTAELFVLDDLRERFLAPDADAKSNTTSGTMADFFEGYAGTVDSREFVQGGANLSSDTSTKFTEIVSAKRGISKPWCSQTPDQSSQ
jgi:hypothetical protein